MDRLFEIERSINGADERRIVRQHLCRPLVDELASRLQAERPKFPRGSDLAKSMDYMRKRRSAFSRFLDDGRIYLSNNAAERSLRGIALGQKSWRFAGFDRGGQRAAAVYTLIVTAKLNEIDPQVICSPETPPFEARVFRSVLEAGKRTEDDEGIEVHGRAEGVHHPAG